MRAILLEAPRKIRLIDDAPKPEPGEGEVIVQCSHVALCGSNMGPYLRDEPWADVGAPAPPGWTGHENVGTIVESRCPDRPVGMRVLAHPYDYNGFVEFIMSKGEHVAPLPSDAEDVAGFIVAQPLATVLRALARTRPVIAQRCAVVGQGPIGLMFTALLRQMGASQVIGIDRVAWRLGWSRRFGATDVVDACAEDTVEAVTELTGGELAEFSVEAVGTAAALNTAAFLVRPQGRLCAFGVPHKNFQEFPWYHTTGNETEILVTRNTWLVPQFFQTAIDMIADGRTQLADMVTPLMPWDRAAEAFEMYANPAESEGSLKLTLVL